MRILFILAATLFAATGPAAAQSVVGGCKIEPGAQCQNANLARARLQGAKLSGANLSGADLGEADLSRADLSKADLRKANLAAANLGGTNLSGANLSGATWMTGRDNYGVPLTRLCAEGSIGECK